MVEKQQERENPCHTKENYPNLIHNDKISVHSSHIQLLEFRRVACATIMSPLEWGMKKLRLLYTHWVNYIF